MKWGGGQRGGMSVQIFALNLGEKNIYFWEGRSGELSPRIFKGISVGECEFLWQLSDRLCPSELSDV